MRVIVNKTIIDDGGRILALMLSSNDNPEEVLVHYDHGEWIKRPETEEAKEALLEIIGR